LPTAIGRPDFISAYVAVPTAQRIKVSWSNEYRRDWALT